MVTYTAKTVEELEKIAPEILKTIGSRRVVTFDAAMGAGKTTLIKALCEAIGTDSIVNSPTFAIVNDYETTTGDSVFHFDMYRLKNIVEAIDMGCEDYFYSGSYCFIEWPEIIESLLPDNIAKISISVGKDNVREIMVD